MKTDEMHVMIDMNNYRINQNISYSKIATDLSKDVAAVSRQLSSKGGSATLHTVYDYAAYLGGSIQFVLDDDYELLAHAREYKKYKEVHDGQEEQITHLSKTVEVQQITIGEQRRMIDELIKRGIEKDKLLNQLLTERGVIKVK